MNDRTIADLVSVFRNVGGSNRAPGTLTREGNENEFEMFFPRAGTAKSLSLALSQADFVPFSKVSKNMGFEDDVVSVVGQDSTTFLLSCSDIIMFGDFGDFDTFLALSQVDDETVLYMDPSSKDVLWYVSPRTLAELLDWLGASANSVN